MNLNLIFLFIKTIIKLQLNNLISSSKFFLADKQKRVLFLLK